MKVSQLQKYLSDFNPEAEIQIVINNYPREYELVFGGSEGCTKLTADNVSFMIDCIKENEYNK